MTQTSIVTEDSIRDRFMWHLIKTDTVSPWGWAKLSVSKLQWRSMIDTSTNNVVILGMLGKKADGKVLFVANKKGQVSAMKLLRTEENATEEAQNWTEIYQDYCQQYHWSIRIEKWMGIPAVIMPVLNQFMTKKERLDNLDSAKERLNLFRTNGYFHGDIYWRNIGYFNAKGKIVVILLDLHPTRVFKKTMTALGHWKVKKTSGRREHREYLLKKWYYRWTYLFYEEYYAMWLPSVSG